MTTSKRPHPARRARRITGAVSAASFLGLGAWFAAHAPSTTVAAAGPGSPSTTSSAKSASANLDDEIGQAASSARSTSTSGSTSTASSTSTAHTTSRGS